MNTTMIDQTRLQADEEPIVHVRLPLARAAARDTAAGTFRSKSFERAAQSMAGQVGALLDSFPGVDGAECAFLRLPADGDRKVVFQCSGAYGLQVVPQAGWLLMPQDQRSPACWIPCLPVLRRLDAQAHVVAERSFELDGFELGPDGWRLEIRLPAGWVLDWVIWTFTPAAVGVARELTQFSSLERQPKFLWGSKVNCRLPADLHRYLLYGTMYTDDFVWPRRWKFFSEIDAHGIYVALDGLQAATGKRIYDLLKRQVLFSVLLRQADDGGWYHGEWTDLMESHYRLHNAAMIVLEAGLEEYGDRAIRDGLVKAATFLSTCIDATDLGTWFLHDSLERSAETMEIMRVQTNTPWLPSRTFGKSPTNKLILNTHLDALVVLDRYRELTGDRSHDALIASGCDAARQLLAMRPAERLYALVYRAIGLTLLPKDAAAALPVWQRALKRLTWKYLTPQMHRIKRVFPRLVMPGGLIERHIAPLHYDINYHPVNVLDLARMRSRFPGLDLDEVIRGAVNAVSESRLLEYWSEAGNRRFAIVVWADALYHLCTLRPDPELQRHLADTMLLAHDAGLGLPPAILGADPEVFDRSRRIRCPSPADPRLLVARLGHGRHGEFIVVNPTGVDLRLDWELNPPAGLCWFSADGRAAGGHAQTPTVPRRGWLLGCGPVDDRTDPASTRMS